MDLRYVFTSPSSPNNDGRILQRENGVTGETVNYTYDALQRLEKAETASAAWGLTWDYDGFGNRWEQRVTKGTAPPNTVSFDQTTNRVNAAGYAHDANGNMTAMPGVWGLAYDVDNRLVSASANGSMEEYAYLADNKRVWKRSVNQNGGTPVEQYYLYGVGGERIATYTVHQQGLGEGLLLFSGVSHDVYFGGRVIWQNGKAVLRDRLGSVMARTGDYTGPERHDYFPYGEERTPTVGDRAKYGTYHRDQTGLDYADQRYYNSTIGRFLSADPAGIAVPGNNGVLGISNAMACDPVNYNDPIGNREQAISVQVCHTRREHVPMCGDGPDRWNTSDVCRSHVVYIQIPDMPLPVPQPIPRDVLFEKCVQDAYEYLDESAKHFRRLRYNHFLNEAVDDAIKQGLNILAIAGMTAVLSSGAGPFVAGAVTLESVAYGVTIWGAAALATTLYHAIRFDLDIRNYHDKLYQPALSMVRQDCDKVVPSSGVVPGQ